MFFGMCFAFPLHFFFEFLRGIRARTDPVRARIATQRSGSELHAHAVGHGQHDSATRRTDRDQCAWSDSSSSLCSLRSQRLPFSVQIEQAKIDAEPKVTLRT